MVDMEVDMEADMEEEDMADTEVDFKNRKNFDKRDASLIDINKFIF